MDQLELRRSRTFGDCWLGLTLWQELRLDRFWADCLSDDCGEVPWEQVLTILAINRHSARNSPKPRTATAATADRTVGRW